MKSVLLAPMGGMHLNFNRANIEALLSLGHEVHLIGNFDVGKGSATKNKETVKYFMELGIKIHSLPFQRASLLKNFRHISAIKELLRQEKYDIVHTHTETGGILLRLAIAAKGSSKWIFTPHGMSFYKGSSLFSQLVYRPIEWWISKRMDGTIGLNEEEYNTFKQWKCKNPFLAHGIGLNIERIQKYSRSREAVRDEFSIPHDATVVLSIGELNDNKNHQVVLSALSEINQPNTYYLICGIGEKKDKLREIASSNGLGDRLILAGYRQDIPDIIHAADLFVFPSFHEGLPVSLMEAMAGGLPIACSRIRGNVDLIKDGENGMLFDPSDSISVKSALEKLLSNPAKATQMAETNKEIIKDFSYDVVKDELVYYYKHVLET